MTTISCYIQINGSILLGWGSGPALLLGWGSGPALLLGWGSGPALLLGWGNGPAPNLPAVGRGILPGHAVWHCDL